MAFLFGGGRRQKSPADIARSLKELLHKLWEPTVNPKVDPLIYEELFTKRLRQVEEDVAKYMSQMKHIVQGTPGHTHYLPALRCKC